MFAMLATQQQMHTFAAGYGSLSSYVLSCTVRNTAVFAMMATQQRMLTFAAGYRSLSSYVFLHNNAGRVRL